MRVGLRISEDCLPIYWDQPTSTTAHNSHQFCVRLVPPVDGQVMPETCRDIEHQWSVVKVKSESGWLCYYVITSQDQWINVVCVWFRYAVIRSQVPGNVTTQSRWPCHLKRRSGAAWFLGSRVRIPLRAWLLVYCVYVGNGICFELIIHSEESHRVCVFVFLIVCEI
jgi:hypothetical protein